MVATTVAGVLLGIAYVCVGATGVAGGFRGANPCAYSGVVGVSGVAGAAVAAAAATA